MLTSLAAGRTPDPDQEDATGTDPAANAAEESEEILEAVLEALPRIGIALVILIVTWMVVRVMKRLLRPRLTERRDESFATVITRLIGWILTVVGVFVAAAVVFPSIKPVDLIAGLGIFSIAIGFAFQDILSNMLSGLLLLIRQPFEIGDQIEVSGQRGTVEAITIRETQIKTFDGEKVVIPNAEVFQNVIRVQTAYGPKRTTIGIGLDDWEDLDRAADVIADATRAVDGVESDPDVQVYFHEFGDATTNLEVRFWTQPEQAEVRRVLDRVVRSIGRALKEHDISMPSPIRELDVRGSVEELVSAVGGRPARDG